MKLSGQISVELNVADYVEAADHQQRLERILERIRDIYPDATLAMRERRQPKAGPVSPPPQSVSRIAQRYDEP
ncbi:hypothetical protein [Phenylobacterium sp. J367]|uniref:hypothetical protein n=1 Tax=Phenylobacterium sp. J367 TaxID=2898435 RepID=UPI002150DDFC|nr:hypothetical protein [Phenylobacterium sp. J367]MCR5880295.1 hypothetical protein [Phenylobacterium sp. J367]